MAGDRRPTLALTQGDPAGIGPEVLLKALSARAAPGPLPFRPLLIIEEAAWRQLEPILGASVDFERLASLSRPGNETPLSEITRTSIEELDDAGRVPWFDPTGPSEGDRRIEFGRSGADDARSALTALDVGIDLVERGVADALVTAPLSKESIARHCHADFRGHTDYLAERAGLERYGRDYLMAFLAPKLQVALLSTHLPLKDAIEAVTVENLLDALRCLDRHGRVVIRSRRPRIAVAGLDPHAGENGLLGTIDEAIVRPAVEQARGEDLEVFGPESADSLFARTMRGEFDWVLALYHDQGLIAVKTASFGQGTNWTLGLPYLRTSVDHGTAFGIAGQGIADEKPLAAVIERTLDLLAG